MGLMQRQKGKSGEREIAGLIRDLTGWDVRRRVRQHDGDSDLTGVRGWSVEVKRRKTAGRSEIASWWRQTAAQAMGVAAASEKSLSDRSSNAGGVPLLLYRSDRADWRAVWPAAIHLIQQRADYWLEYAWTVEGTVECWAAVARELATDGARE